MLRRASLIAAILASIVLANLLVTADPRWAVFDAFALIGLDLVARDRLHDLWRRHRALKLGALIGAGAALSYALNADAERVALASAIAFAAAFTADAIVYQAVRLRPWLERANISNLPSAAVDSVVFPAIAFGLDPVLAFTIFAAKVGGGAFWSLVLQPRRAALRATA